MLIIIASILIIPVVIRILFILWTILSVKSLISISGGISDSPSEEIADKP